MRETVCRRMVWIWRWNESDESHAELPKEESSSRKRRSPELKETDPWLFRANWQYDDKTLLWNRVRGAGGDEAALLVWKMYRQCESVERNQGIRWNCSRSEGTASVCTKEVSL